MLFLAILAATAALSDPDVDNYNFRVGTQQIGGNYQFTTNTLLVEASRAIWDMGCNILKITASSNYTEKYRIPFNPAITTLTQLVRDEASYRTVLDMPFKYYQMWTYPFGLSYLVTWQNGLSKKDQRIEYNEIYDFTRYLLTNYSNSGKTFYLGHWEGDWYLLKGYERTNTPTRACIQGMIDWLNIRQKAVDDAKKSVRYSNVNVYHYTEVVTIADAMGNPPFTTQRVINCVVPFVTNLDYVSWSSYTSQDAGEATLLATLNYANALIPTNKAAAIPGRRLFVGEYGWGWLPPERQEPKVRAYLKTLVGWGCPFTLWWEMYDNEGKQFCLIDSNGTKTLVYDFHRGFLKEAKSRVLEWKRSHGDRLPSSAEYESLVLPLFDKPFPPIRGSNTNSSGK